MLFTSSLVSGAPITANKFMIFLMSIRKKGRDGALLGLGVLKRSLTFLMHACINET